MKCDKIFVMEKGKFIEEGTHKSLLESKGKYYKLWKDQLPDKSIFEETEAIDAVAVEESPEVEETETTPAIVTVAEAAERAAELAASEETPAAETTETAEASDTGNSSTDEKKSDEETKTEICTIAYPMFVQQTTK